MTELVFDTEYAGVHSALPVPDSRGAGKGPGKGLCVRAGSATGPAFSPYRAPQPARLPSRRSWAASCFLFCLGVSCLPVAAPVFKSGLVQVAFLPASPRPNHLQSSQLLRQVSAGSQGAQGPPAAAWSGLARAHPASQRTPCARPKGGRGLSSVRPTASCRRL